MDRNALADALAGATVEQLREDAEWLAGEARFEERHGDLGRVPRWERLAALALAVATMQERGEEAIEQNPDRPHILSWMVGADGGVDWVAGDVGDFGANTLPAALAALVREGA